MIVSLLACAVLMMSTGFAQAELSAESAPAEVDTKAQGDQEKKRWYKNIVPVVVHGFQVDRKSCRRSLAAELPITTILFQN